MTTFEAGGRQYQWLGGFGAIFSSRERGLQPGDVRMIGDELFYVFAVEATRWRTPKVSWTQPNSRLSAEHIRELRRRLFRIDAGDRP
jgi:hypothetical protein